MHAVITETTAHNYTTRGQQPSRWTYDTAHPATITMSTPRCLQQCCWTTWETTRHLIIEAYLRHTGEGDICAYVEDGYLHLHLRSPSGHGQVAFDAAHLWRWLLDTFEVMPPCRNQGRCTTGPYGQLAPGQTGPCRECDALAAGTDALLDALLTGGQ